MTPQQLQEPDVKTLYQGTCSLSDAETIGLILAGVDSTEKAKSLLTAAEYDFRKLSNYSYVELKEMGLSHLQAIRLMAVCEFSRRKALQTVNEKTQIRSSQDIQEIFAPILADLGHEEFWVMFLNRSNKITKRERVSMGGNKRHSD